MEAIDREAILEQAKWKAQWVVAKQREMGMVYTRAQCQYKTGQFSRKYYKQMVQEARRRLQQDEQLHQSKVKETELRVKTVRNAFPALLTEAFCNKVAL